LGLTRLWSGFIAITAPLLFYFIGFKNFLELVGLVGGIFVGLDSLFVILIWRKVRKIDAEVKILKKVNPLIIFSLIFIFALGIILEIVH